MSFIQILATTGLGVQSRKTTLQPPDHRSKPRNGPQCGPYSSNKFTFVLILNKKVIIIPTLHEASRIPLFDN